MNTTLQHALGRARVVVGSILKMCGRRKDPLVFLAQSKGLIHIGANEGQEAAVYAAYDIPVLWIEALPDVFAVLQKNIQCFPKQKCMCALLDRVAGRPTDFNTAGTCSSLFEMNDLSEVLQISRAMGKVALVTNTLDALLENTDVAYDAIVIDVQGAEKCVLEGAQETLRKVKWILAEASNYAAYKGGCTLKELSHYLRTQGFKPRRKWCARWAPGIGAEYDVLYERMGR